MKRNKSVYILFVLTFLLAIGFGFAQQVSAQSIDLTGGIKNEYDYEEYIFITGKPILFKGTDKNVSVSVKENKGKLTETYKFTLTGPSGEKLTRNFTYTYDVTNYDQIGQSAANGTVTKFTEKIVIGSTTYTLVDYQLSKSTITDKRPASDYYSGNANARKTYTMDKAGINRITVTVDSRNTGYENFWGATETQITESAIEYPNGTEGYVKNSVSTTKSRTLEYTENDASLASFNGNYRTISSSDTISEYEYDLPLTKGVVELNIENMPRIEMLKIPKFRDLSTHWARENIEKLYSLGILDDESNFFSPNTPMLRYEFAIAIGKAIDIRVFEDTTKKSKIPAKSVFNDVSRTTKGYNYLSAAVDKGVIKGINSTNFSPNSSLTREQAVTILVRALGLENKAPDPGYVTEYGDDHRISDYARDSIYVATELGLLSGVGNNLFNPKGTLTRAQSSAIIERFLQYLEADLKQNYRDDILFFD